MTKEVHLLRTGRAIKQKRNENVCLLSNKTEKNSQKHPKNQTNKIIFKKVGLIEMPNKVV